MWQFKVPLNQTSKVQQKEFKEAESCDISVS